MEAGIFVPTFTATAPVTGFSFSFREALNIIDNFVGGGSIDIGSICGTIATDDEDTMGNIGTNVMVGTYTSRVPSVGKLGAIASLGSMFVVSESVGRSFCLFKGLKGATEADNVELGLTFALRVVADLKESFSFRIFMASDEISSRFSPVIPEKCVFTSSVMGVVSLRPGVCFDIDGTGGASLVPSS